MPRKRKRTTGRRTTALRRRTRSRRSSVSASESLDQLLELKPETKRQISGAIQIALAVIFFLILEGNAGVVGEAIRDGIVFLFGAAGVILPVGLGLSGLFFIFRGDKFLQARSTFGLVISLVAVLGFIHIQAPLTSILDDMGQLGGAVGFMVAFPLLAFTSLPVAYVVVTAMFIIGTIIAFDINMHEVVRMIMHRPQTEETESDEQKNVKKTKRSDPAKDLIEKGMKQALQPAKDQEKEEETELNIVRPSFEDEEAMAIVTRALKEKSAVARAAADRKKGVSVEGEDEIDMKDTYFDDWEFPSLDALDPSRSEVMVDDATLKEQAQRIAQKLKEFDVNVTMRHAHPGPTVTQFTLQPSEGVKLSRIASLKNDLALALAAPSLRIEAPIPGKSLVGIEMPNEKRTVVHLREMLESTEFRQSVSPLTLPLGRDVSGAGVVQDLTEMPHLMIAGATGSGKSVCMNTFLISLLFQNAPHDLKLILIDPKRVELALYDGIPHLLTPVITEAEQALKALRWTVAEMGRRLARFSEVGARNLEEYNGKQDSQQRHLPRIVVVIDELADLMMRQYRRDTETMITRIAQIARATGIHLIIATQRPSVDVITGIIKANIPTRIAFRTVSSIDSRTILDTIGAEDLLGKGDLLFTTASTSMPVRVQGIFVSSEEVERVINQVKISGGGAITAEINFGGSAAKSENDDEYSDEERGPLPVLDLDADDNGGDDLTFEAVELVQRTGKASASLLQRHLKVGYARAARILDILEEKGVVGPADGAKPRKVYVEAVS